MRPWSSWRGVLRACLLVVAVAAAALRPEALFAHGSEFVYVRMQRLNAHDNTWVIRASIEHLDNPLAPDEAAARLALTRLLTIAPNTLRGAAVSAERTPSWVLGEPQWTSHHTWDDPSAPVPMPDAMADGREHRWLTAKWMVKLPREHATACFRVSSDTKLGVVLWEVESASARPVPATRWQILLPGDQSFIFGDPGAIAVPPSSDHGAQRG